MANKYSFSTSKSGEIVPSLVLPSGEVKPLHSMVDPKNEAARLVSTIPNDTGFIFFLGLGGGFAPLAVLENTNAQVLVIEFDSESITELLSSKDYSPLLNSNRFNLFVDPTEQKIKNFILENYKPSLCGGARSIPLRPRLECNHLQFEDAWKSIQEALEIVSSDYSVQAHFGMRWFSNIIHNLKNMEEKQLEGTQLNLPKGIEEAAIVAAGPSLDQQIPLLKKCKSNGVFVISSDTALPVMLQNSIEPDVVVSIDCQHISYYHFLSEGGKIKAPLILDIASPPMLSRISPSVLFFCSGHPLAQYIHASHSPFMQLDTSGGNVTYACLSLAQNIGAKKITLFGADFSYVNSRSYARGTYIYPFFEKKQNRFAGLESLFSAFLYRTPFLPAEDAKQIYRETSSLRFYRKKLEEKACGMNAQITAAEGCGAPINFYKTEKEKSSVTMQNIGKINSIDFLKQYKNDIALLPEVSFSELDRKNKQILTTLLPYAAALKHRNKEIKQENLIKETKIRCIEKIEKALKL